MDYIKKTILLTNKSKQMAVLNITKSGNGYFANFRNYSHFVENCILGIAVGDDRVIKQNVLCNKPNGYDFKLGREFDINSNLGCVLLEDGKTNKPIVWGADNSKICYKSVVLEYIDSMSRDGVSNRNVVNSNMENVSNSDRSPKTVDSKKITKYNDDTSIVSRISDSVEVIDSGNTSSELDTSSVNDKSENVGIESNKYSLQSNNKFLNEAKNESVVYGVRDSEDVVSMGIKEELFDEGDIEEEINNAIVGEGGNFFDMISEQIDALFDQYPEESNLARVVPGSRWVKVNYEGNEHTYVVGLLYETEVIKYVAYGVPGKGTDSVPENLDGYGQWIPVDPDRPDDEGYFVMFQDANTGESIRQK